MITQSTLTTSCGIGPNQLYVMIQSSLHHVLMRHSRTSFDGPMLERLALANHIPQLRGCIGFVDGTLVKIRRPYENKNHNKWFQGRKKMYCMNSTILIDHHGLFIFVDPGYPGSFHDVTILKNSMVEAYWRQLFTHTDEYSEFVLGD